MSRDKQIDEMAKVIVNENDCIIPCRSCAYYEYEDCRGVMVAERLYNAGYRKASDVIDEFAERFMKNILEYTLGNDSLAYFLKGYINKTANEMKGEDND